MKPAFDVPRLVKMVLQGTTEHLCLVSNLLATAGLYHLPCSEQRSVATPLSRPLSRSQLHPFRVSLIQLAPPEIHSRCRVAVSSWDFSSFAFAGLPEQQQQYL